VGDQAQGAEGVEDRDAEGVKESGEWGGGHPLFSQLGGQDFIYTPRGSLPPHI